MKATCELHKCLRAHTAHAHKTLPQRSLKDSTLRGCCAARAWTQRQLIMSSSCFPACVYAATQPRTSTCPATPPACQLQKMLSRIVNMQLVCNRTATHQTSNATSSTRPATTCEQQHQHTSGHAVRRMRHHSMVGVGMLKRARHASATSGWLALQCVCPLWVRRVVHASLQPVYVLCCSSCPCARAWNRSYPLAVT